MVAVAVAIMVLGLTQLPKMPVDALPEFSPPQVEIQTEALGLSAAEVEQLITVPLEADLLNGVAFLDEIRSESIPGLSSIELVFEPGTDLLEARQVVAERLTQAHALPNVSRPPSMLQPRSSTGRVLMVGLSSEQLSLIEMSVLARWKVRPYLMGVPGVANVAIWGQREQQLQVQVDPDRLRKHGVELGQIIETTGNALWVSPLSFVEASTPGTGGFIDTPNQRLGVQHISPLTTADDLASVTVQDTGGRTIRLGDVANVVEDHQPLIGDAVVDDSQSLMLVIEKFPGTGATEVTRDVEKALEALAPALPSVEIDSTLYRPADFIDAAGGNIAWALMIGFVLLVLLLVLVYRDWRLVVLTAGALATSVTAALLVLYMRGATFNLMYLAGLAVALAILIDDAVADNDRFRRGAGDSPQGPRVTAVDVLDSSRSSRRDLLIPTLIVVASAVPVLMLGGLPGEFSAPMVISYLLAVIASMLVALTLVPALRLVLRQRTSRARGTSVERGIVQGYGAFLKKFVHSSVWTYVVLVGGVVIAASTIPLLGGREIIPQLQQQQLLIEWDGPPGTSQQEMARVTALASSELRLLPGVSGVGGHIGRAITSDEVASVNSAALWVTVDPAVDYERTTRAVQEVIHGYPGLVHEVETYPDERIREAQTGTDDDLVVRIYGQDPATLADLADDVRGVIDGVPGVVNPQIDVEPVSPTVEIEVDLEAAEEHAIKPGDVRRAAAILLSGIEVGSLFEEQKVFEVVVWGTPAIRQSLSDVEDLLIDRPRGGQVRLGDVASVEVAPNASSIARESVSRMIDVSATVEGRGLDDVRDDVERAIADVGFPVEYHAVVLDASPLGRADLQRLLNFSLAALVVIFLLLQVALRSWRLALVVVASLPASIVGSLLAALAFGGDLTITTAVGLLGALGISIRFAVILLRRCEELRLEADGRTDASMVRRAAGERAVPVIVTTAAVFLFFVPSLTMGDVPGLEVIRPAVAVLLGGVITSALTTLLVLPPLYLALAPVGLPSGDDELDRDSSPGSDHARQATERRVP